ncbi:MAG: Smr/MutS family protein [Spirochaetes bacterium]|jgi:DNA-nicking Smr family endonuclease|nr:Smr/MutS family protein [Spirochaetota bacterium]
MEDEPVKIELKDEIDLHPFHPKDVKYILQAFIDNACEKGFRRLRIAHGKGQSVIKSIVINELGRDERVASFKDDAGNWGATIVILK